MTIVTAARTTVGGPRLARGNLPPPPSRFGAYRHLDHEADTKPCSGNAECSSYRCIDGYCDDKSMKVLQEVRTALYLLYRFCTPAA